MAKKVILDCDPGIDDSMAIVLAAKAPELELLAVTTTHGNYPVDVTEANARKMLELLGRNDVPVGRGMAHPLVRQSPSDPFSHGADGQAENFLPASRLAPDPRHASQLIADLAAAHSGEVTLISTAPMSNIALALLQKPSLKKDLCGIVAISGMFGLNRYAFENATGDTPQSEWNVYVDPEAAKIVYESGVPLVAIGLDVATHFDVDFSDADLARLEASARPEAAFLRQAIHYVTGRGYGAYCTVIDCMAVACAIDRGLVTTFTGRVGIETQGALTLGMTVVDRRHHHVWEHFPSVEIAESADHARFLALLLDRVLA